jgi:anti-anti-sigma factor
MTTREAGASVRRRGDVAIIELVGDVDARAEHVLGEAWTQAAGGRPGVVALSFSGAGFINSTGIALIVGLLARARAEGIEVRAWGLSDHYREIFEITRLADFMRITSDETSAVQGAEGSSDD